MAFLISALLYDRYGITGSACFGAGLEASLLLGSLVYLVLCASKQRASKTKPRYDLVASAGNLKQTNSLTNGPTYGHNTAYNPFAAVAGEKVPGETLKATQAEAGLGADPIALQLSKSMSMSLHSSQQSGDDQLLGLHASLLLGSSFVIPEDSPACADVDTGGWREGLRRGAVKELLIAGAYSSCSSRVLAGRKVQVTWQRMCLLQVS